MNRLLSTTRSLPASNQESTAPNRNPSSYSPTSRTLLNRVARCCKKMTVSAVTKNIAGLMIGTGTGVALGCPWLLGLLIGVGLGTAWIGGAGIALIGIGLILWTASTVLSAQKDDACDSLPLEIGFSAFMGVIGIPYVIFSAIGNSCNSFCCEEGSEEDACAPATKKITTAQDVAEFIWTLNPEERRVLVQRCMRADLPDQAQSDANLLQPPKLLSQVPGQLIPNAFPSATLVSATDQYPLDRPFIS